MTDKLNRDERVLAVEVDNTVLTAGPRHARPGTDDVVLSVRHTGVGTGRSILLSRAQAREVRDWLDQWLEHGWPGVPQVEGPSNADVITHFQEIALRAQRDLDRLRCGGEPS